MASSLSRRRLLLAGGAAGLFSMLRGIPFAQAEGEDPHFLIAIQIRGGVDGAYTFDARPAKLTEKGLRQNYLLQNDASSATTRPDELTPEKTAARTVVCERTGSTSIRSPLFDSVWTAHKDHLSIINGVHMLSANDGHEGNSRYLWNNDATGTGPLFPPTVGAAIGGMPLDAIAFGDLSGSNLASTYTVSALQGGLGRALAAAPGMDETTSLGRHLIARADANAAGDGVFSRGSGQLANGLRNARRTTSALRDIAPADDAYTVSMVDAVKGALRAFSAGLTRVAAIPAASDVDFHDVGSSQMRLVTTYADLASQLKECLDLLTTTMFTDANGRTTPFIERTTFLVASEFGRTNLTSNGSSCGATGSDHNVHGNSVLIGGKGIVGGLVVGETDLRDCDDARSYLDVSPAHRLVDPGLLRAFGKPFDFDAQRVRTDLPSVFREEEHILFPSVTNTILEAFGVPEAARLRQGARTAPTLSVLRRAT